jgi:hypothetical protein
MPRKAKERLYFIIRSYIMGVVGGVVFPLMALILGSINFIQAIFLGFFSFLASLAISRYFESPIERITKKTLVWLNRHQKIRKFIMKRF